MRQSESRHADGGLSGSLPGGVSAQMIRGELEKLLESRHFAHAPRMRRFLRYVVEQTIRGEADSVKEILLGIKVFDKGESFDPAADPIVRIEAGRLRDRLKRYYRTEGRADSLMITVPKGTYVPSFRKRLPPPAPLQPGAGFGQHEGHWRRIAMLPFTDLGPEHAQEFFCDGVVEELIGVLTKTPGLQVVAWDSARRYKGSARDIRRIGTELDVDSVVEGSVIKTPDRIRVSVRLADTTDGCYVWSETYEALFQDILTLQDTIAGAVVSALRLHSGESRAGRLPRRPILNPEAYRLFLKGRYHARRRTEEGLWKGVQYLEQALQADAVHALAYACLAEAYALLAWYGFAPAAQVMPKARTSALRALEVDSALAEAHMSLGLVRELYDWEWDSAGEEFRLASELNSGDAAVLFECGFFLSRMGQLDEGLQFMRCAQELDPLSAVVHTNMGVNLYYQRSFEKAMHCYLEALELDESYYPAHFRLGIAYLQMGAPAPAVASLARAKALAGNCPLVLGLLGYALAVTGDRQGAGRLLTELETLASIRYVRPLSGALICMGLGKGKETFEWLETAYLEHDAQLVDINIDPLYDALRLDPRFQALLRKMNFLG